MDGGRFAGETVDSPLQFAGGKSICRWIDIPLPIFAGEERLGPAANRNPGTGSRIPDTGRLTGKLALGPDAGRRSPAN